VNVTYELPLIIHGARTMLSRDCMDSFTAHHVAQQHVVYRFTCLLVNITVGLLQEVEQFVVDDKKIKIEM
jgi:hypothetical protein